MRSRCFLCGQAKNKVITMNCGIMASCVLHNMAMEDKVPVDLEVDENEPVPNRPRDC